MALQKEIDFSCWFNALTTGGGGLNFSQYDFSVSIENNLIQWYTNGGVVGNLETSGLSISDVASRSALIQLNESRTSYSYFGLCR